MAESETELRRRRNETYAKWIKEVALLFLAALVVQNIIAGASAFSISVLFGASISFLMYYRAYQLMER